MLQLIFRIDECNVKRTLNLILKKECIHGVSQFSAAFEFEISLNQILWEYGWSTRDCYLVSVSLNDNRISLSLNETDVKKYVVPTSYMPYNLWNNSFIPCNLLASCNDENWPLDHISQHYWIYYRVLWSLRCISVPNNLAKAKNILKEVQTACQRVGWKKLQQNLQKTIKTWWDI